MTNKLYLRIAKTGSTSFSSVLPDNVIEVTASLKHKKLFQRHHYDFKFTIVRNPYDRLVSAYKMLSQSEVATNFYSPGAKKEFLGIPFDEFIDKVSYYRARHEEFGVKKAGNVHLRPTKWSSLHCMTKSIKPFEVYWVLAHTDSMVDCIEFFLPVSELDFVGRYESLDSDFKKIQKILHIEKNLPRMNTSKDTTKYSKYYNRKTQEIIATMYAQDFETFSYEFSIDHSQ